MAKLGSLVVPKPEYPPPVSYHHSVVENCANLRTLNGMLEHFTMSMSSVGFSSASSSSDEESMTTPVSPLPRSGRHGRSMSYSARMVRRSEANNVCRSKSSLVAVMIQAIAHRVNYVWVIEDDCGLVGIVTFSDMFEVFREHLKPWPDKMRSFCFSFAHLLLGFDANNAEG